MELYKKLSNAYLLSYKVNFLNYYTKIKFLLFFDSQNELEEKQAQTPTQPVPATACYSYFVFSCSYYHDGSTSKSPDYKFGQIL